MWNRLKSFLLFNNNTGQTIIKNIVWLFSGQIISRFLRATIVIYSARILGAGSYGAFSYALGIAAFLTIFSDIGINALITKEAARNPELKDKYLSTAFFLKLGLLIIFILATIATFPYLTNIQEAAAIMPILIFVFAFDTLRDLGSALSRALEKMEIEATVNIFTNLSITILGFIFLTINPASYSLATAYALGSGLGLIAIFITLKGHFKNILTHFTPKLVKEILVTAWPFGLMGLMGAIMLNTDIIMLGWMRSPGEVGYYSAAQKLILLAYILPGLLASSTFPSLSKFAKSEPEKAKYLLGKSTAIIIVVAVILLIAGLFLGDFTFNLLYGKDYAPGIPTFKILLFTMLVVFPGTLFGNALFAYDESKYFLKFVTISTLLNAGLNFLLIPQYGIEGAAISTIVTQLITNIFVYIKIKKISGFKVWIHFQNIFS